MASVTQVPGITHCFLHCSSSQHSYDSFSSFKNPAGIKTVSFQLNRFYIFYLSGFRMLIQYGCSYGMDYGMLKMLDATNEYFTKNRNFCRGPPDSLSE